MPRDSNSAYAMDGESDRAALSPTRPAIKYFGSKWSIAPWIISHMPPHSTYVEPFAGSASVLLRKPPARVEVLNDRSGDVVNFFRVLRERGRDLIEVLRLTPVALDEQRVAREPAACPVERARRFFLASWVGIQGANGDGRSRGFRRTPDVDVAGQIANAVDALPGAVERLRRVTIENLPALEVLRRYDRPHTLFYVDPPYLRATRTSPAPSNGYGRNDLDDDAHAELLELLRRLQGTVVLSGYPHPLYDDALRGWHTVDADVPSQKRTRRTERLWINRPRRDLFSGPQEAA